MKTRHSWPLDVQVLRSHLVAINKTFHQNNIDSKPALQERAKGRGTGLQSCRLSSFPIDAA